MSVTLTDTTKSESAVSGNQRNRRHSRLSPKSDSFPTDRSINPKSSTKPTTTGETHGCMHHHRKYRYRYEALSLVENRFRDCVLTLIVTVILESIEFRRHPRHLPSSRWNQESYLRIHALDSPAMCSRCARNARVLHPPSSSTLSPRSPNIPMAQGHPIASKGGRPPVQAEERERQ